MAGIADKSNALKDYVEVDNVDLSNDAYGVHPNLTDEQLDVSGFSATGADESIAGRRTTEVTVDFYWTQATHAVLYWMYQNRIAVDFAWRPDQTVAASSSNPELRGSVNLLSFPPEAARGEVRRFSVTFVAADPTGLVFYKT